MSAPASVSRKGAPAGYGNDIHGPASTSLCMGEALRRAGVQPQRPRRRGRRAARPLPPCHRRASAAKGPGGGSSKRRGDQDLCAGEDEGGGLQVPPPAEPSVRGQVEVAAFPRSGPPFAAGMEQQQRVHPAGIETGREPVPSQSVAVRTPYQVGVEDEEGLGAQQRQRMGDAAAGFQPLRLAGNTGFPARLRPARWASISAARWWVLTTARVRPRPRQAGRARGRSTPCRRRCRSGFGGPSPRRDPSPAASTMAVCGSGARHSAAGMQRSARDMAAEPCRQRLQRRVGEIALKHPPEPGQVAHIAGFAVAPGKPHEGSEHADMALRAEDGDVAVQVPDVSGKAAR